MKRTMWIVLLSVLSGVSLTARGEELVFCGWDEVFIADVKDSNYGEIKKLWSWRAEDRTDLPEEIRGLFETTDECKPVDGGRRLLISSSGGGLAVVERSTGNVLWYGYVGNAHSIELLPHDRVVVAGSTNAKGNKLAVFELQKSNEIVFETKLHSGHGVVWDEKRQLLWALGYEELRAYGLDNWQTDKPKLVLKHTYEIPSASGHDLLMTPKGKSLLLTTNQVVYSFDPETETFSPYTLLEGLRRVKSISIHSVNQRVAYVQAEGENWWSTRVRFLGPAGELTMEKEHLYKARWVIP